MSVKEDLLAGDSEIDGAARKLIDVATCVASGKTQNVFLVTVEEDDRSEVLLLRGSVGRGLRMVGAIELLRGRLMRGLSEETGT